MKNKTLKPGWNWVKFGDVVCQCKEKVDPETTNLERYVAGDHMDTDDLRLRRWGIIGTGYLGPAFNIHFKPGQVLYGSRRTYLRKVSIASFEGICSNTTFVLEPKDLNRLMSEFLPFLMQTDDFNDFSVKNSKGSVNPYINFSDLAKYEFALPSLNEQERIVDVLCNIEKCLDSIDFLTDSAEKLRRSLMIDHFESNFSEYRKVSEIGKWASGGTPSRGNPDYWGGEIPWISPKDMKRPELDSAGETLTIDGVKAGSRLMPKDSIMIVVRGMILAHTFPVARTLVPAAFNQDMKALVVSEEYRPKYIQYWFEHAAPRYLQLASASSHGTKRLESDKLFSLSVPKIPLDEQDYFIEKIDHVRTAVKMSKAKLYQTKIMKSYFLNQNL
ncbi:restriction endonuclease subunit S [Escherichia coli]|uniref:restriction endonuclease subunit S n=1 Tax=Escherichia coli TaxID=562 RepID=UPI0010789472|nr:restriction endonuclease subunit S [Escherichia coli]EKT9987273.1 restriction endonuclease subunit S [Enterobacter ludwigii]EAC1521276.1 restriction endonuclease subunit S [Escherichia coli]EEV5874837.1 restriction endonuclease subunit S [Escherichia coli]EFA6969453.1 restriction endonuclease subunit S [Escherichia coli]EFA7624363.1 restriction endonuclease subunit S [Escherichia coli]